VPVPIANGRIGPDDGLRYRPPMETIAPPRSLRGRWWDTVVGAGPLVVGLLIAFVALGLYVAYRVLDPTPDKRIVIATGPEEGAYIEFAKRYQPLLRAHGLAVELRTTQGSSENLALLRDPQSGVDAAFVQGGVDTVDTGEYRTVASLGSVAYEPVWLFCREPDARELRDKARLNNLSQLAGWRINTGPSGGGAGPLFRQLAQANHIEATQLQLGEKPAVHAVVDLLQGRTDAVLMVAAADAPLVQYLLRAPGIRLFEFVQAEAYTRRFPFLRAVTLPRGIVDLAADKPPQANSIFTVRFDFGSTHVAVPADIAVPLIADAKAAPLVLLRGRTDGSNDALAESRIARERAAAVRDYLVASGVDPARIRATYQPVGDHVADNSSNSGRSLNRRVEIELYRVLPIGMTGAPPASQP